MWWQGNVWKVNSYPWDSSQYCLKMDCLQEVHLTRLYAVYHREPLYCSISGSNFDSAIERPELFRQPYLLEVKLHKEVFHWHKLGSVKLSTTRRACQKSTGIDLFAKTEQISRLLTWIERLWERVSNDSRKSDFKEMSSFPEWALYRWFELTPRVRVHWDIPVSWSTSLAGFFWNLFELSSDLEQLSSGNLSS